jgi:superoxide dismutase, Fe-Mn family
MSAAADGMSASGWIWLVSDQTGRLGIVPTYGAGTLLIRARRQQLPPIRGELPEIHAGSLAPNPSIFSHQTSRNQTRSISNGFSTSGTIHRPPPPLSPTEQRRSFLTKGTTSTASTSALNHDHDNKRGVVLNPLLCISVFEHAWLGSGYGVWGKKEYLRRFWSVVDWEQVSKNYQHWIQVDKNG